MESNYIIMNDNIGEYNINFYYPCIVENTTLRGKFMVDSTNILKYLTEANPYDHLSEIMILKMMEHIKNKTNNEKEINENNQNDIFETNDEFTKIYAKIHESRDLIYDYIVKIASGKAVNNNSNEDYFGTRIISQNYLEFMRA